MPRFSANLGFLWNDLPMDEAIKRAAMAGFDAVECHWPYGQDYAAIRDALNQTGLSMLGLNTWKGEGSNAFGLSALPNHIAEARAAIDRAIETAKLLNVSNVHVMAGRASGPLARKTFLDNLNYACQIAAPFDIVILIEPLNPHDAPGYHFCHTDEAVEIISSVGANNLKLMFDCYHVARVEEPDTAGLIKRARQLLPHIGHIQFASVPDRGPPGHGAIDYRTVFEAIDAMGWTAPLGAEYRVEGKTEATLDWMTWISPLKQNRCDG